MFPQFSYTVDDVASLEQDHPNLRMCSLVFLMDEVVPTDPTARKSYASHCL